MIKAIVFWGGCMLFASQFEVMKGLYGGIDTSNYFALLLGTMVAIAWLLKIPKTLYWGDIVAFGLFVYLLIHASMTHAMQCREFYLSVSYFALYAVFRTIKELRLSNYMTFAVMICGIYQSYLVLRQLLGYDTSNHLRFIVTGSFFNPGPCGIFLAGVFVLSAIMIRKGTREIGFNLMCVRYVMAWITFCLTIVAMIPTMSRAGWIGALIGIILIYRKGIAQWIKASHRWVIGSGIVGFMLIFTLFYLLKKDSANGRLFIWQNTIAAYSKAPLFGVGINGFEKAYAEAQHDYFIKENALEQEHHHAELAGVVESAFNEPLALFLLLGTMGGVLVVIILFFKLRRLTDYGCVVTSLLVASLFSYTFYVPSIAILFLFATAQLPDRKIKIARYANVLMFGMMGIVALFFDFQEFVRKDVYREWKNHAIYYTQQDYESVINEYKKIYPLLKNDFKFLFEYGHSLHKVGRYEESNTILKKGIEHSADPMFWNIIGNNYLALKQYEKGAAAYLQAYHMCPNRVYPLYLLTKLEAERGDTVKMNYYGHILLKKQPKVPSLAVEEMKNEIKEMLGITS